MRNLTKGDCEAVIAWSCACGSDPFAPFFFCFFLFLVPYLFFDGAMREPYHQ
jgi:hypothetical protein